MCSTQTASATGWEAMMIKPSDGPFTYPSVISPQKYSSHVAK